MRRKTGTMSKTWHLTSIRLSFILFIITGWTLLIFSLSMFYRLIFSFILQTVFSFPSYSLLFFHEKLTFPVVIFGFLSILAEIGLADNLVISSWAPPSLPLGWAGTNSPTPHCLMMPVHSFWRRKWQPTLVFLPGESCGWRSLVGCCLWGRTESDTTEAT